MHALIERLLRKRGIESPEKLDGEEKKTFEGWQAILTKEELTMDDLQKFIQSQIDVIETRWKDLTVDNDTKAQLIPYHTTYKTLLMAINAPAQMRSALEIQLQQLINQ